MAVDHVVSIVIGHRAVCHTVECLGVLEGEDVYDTAWVVSDPTVAPEVTNHVDKGLAPVGPNGDGFFDAVDVGEHGVVVEDVYGRLVVEKHPGPVEQVSVPVLSETIASEVWALHSNPWYGVWCYVV